MGLIPDLSESEWKDFSARTPELNLFQSPLMYRVFAGTVGYRPRVVAWDVGGQIRNVLVAVEISYTRRVFSRFTARTVATGGPVGDSAAIPDLIREHDKVTKGLSLLTEIRNLQRPDWKHFIEQTGYQWRDHLNYTIDLRPGPKAILGEMDKSRRKGIARAERSNLNFIRLGFPSLPELYKTLSASYQRARIPIADASLFRNAFNILQPAEHLRAYAAVSEGRIVATRIELCWDRIMFDWYAGSTDEGRSLRADEWLVWKILNEACESGYGSFDFGGAGAPGNGYGPGEFKKQFGGIRSNPGRFEKVYHPMALRVSSSVYGLWRRFK